MRLRSRVQVVLAGALIVTALPQSSLAGESNSFIDDDNSRYEPYIETASRMGLVKGCNPPENDRFCPGHIVTRGEVAIMLARFIGPPVSVGNHYVDDDGHPAERAIESLASLGVTLGCDPERFCPDQAATRGEMAALISRVLGWEQPETPHPFLDLDDSPFGPPLVELARRGGIESCDQPVGRRLCPNLTVRRDEAVFSLITALDLEPTPVAAPVSDLPAIGFSDGFDSLALWDGRTPSSRNRINLTSEGFDGSGLRVSIAEGSHFGADFRLDLSRRFGEEPEHLFFRYFLRLDPDWSPSTGGKLPGFSGVYGRAGKGGYPSQPSAPGWSARLQFFPTREDDARAGIGYYVYHLGQERRYGDGMPWNEAGKLIPGDWYCLEGEIELNKRGLADGALRAWVDGTPAFDMTGLEFRRPEEPNIRIESFWFNVYYGGKAVAETELGLTIDEVVVDTRRIGCDVGSGTTRAIAADLNGDGFDDRLWWGDCPGGACFWKKITSTSARVSSRRYPGLAWFSLETSRLGMASGDFDGDGSDDLLYRGRCDESVRCWRVHRFSGPTLGLGENWGDGARFSGVARSIVVGDWDGDGLADLGYQGICGTDGHECWRVHRSTGDRFAAPEDWGPRPIEPITALSADLTGDGLDDLIYTAPCDDKICWLVHKSAGAGFDEAAVLGHVKESEFDWHDFVDFNGDGQADLVSTVFEDNSTAIKVRLMLSHSLAAAVGVAGFDDAVSEVLVRRLHLDGPVEALVTTPCGDGSTCVVHLAGRSMRLLPLDEYFRHYYVWLRQHRFE